MSTRTTTARPIALPSGLTAAQRVATAALVGAYQAERIDQSIAFRLWTGERNGQPILEYQEAEERIAQRREPEGAWDTGWRNLYGAFDGHPPDALVEALRCWGWESADEDRPADKLDGVAA